jgi:6-phosphogluconolactonase
MSASVRLEVVSDPAGTCAGMLVRAIASGGDVVLTGGSTPRTAYEQVAGTIAAERIDVGCATLWFGDERSVPPDDERSNYLMAKRTLLDPVGEESFAAVNRIPGELGFDTAADDYERALRAAGPPRFDLLLLGIGSDGHTASMFPDQPSVGEQDRFVVGVPEAGLEPFVARVTMTLPALALGNQIVVLAVGASKADAVAAAFAPSARPDPHVPSSMLSTLDSEVIVLLDEAAAGKL